MLFEVLVTVCDFIVILNLKKQGILLKNFLQFHLNFILALISW